MVLEKLLTRCYKFRSLREMTWPLLNEEKNNVNISSQIKALHVIIIILMTITLLNQQIREIITRHTSDRYLQERTSQESF